MRSMYKIDRNGGAGGGGGQKSFSRKIPKFFLWSFPNFEVLIKYQLKILLKIVITEISKPESLNPRVEGMI